MISLKHKLVSFLYGGAKHYVQDTGQLYLVFLWSAETLRAWAIEMRELASIVYILEKICDLRSAADSAAEKQLAQLPATSCMLHYPI